MELLFSIGLHLVIIKIHFYINRDIAQKLELQTHLLSICMNEYYCNFCQSELGLYLLPNIMALFSTTAAFGPTISHAANMD